MTDIDLKPCPKCAGPGRVSLLDRRPEPVTLVSVDCLSCDYTTHQITCVNGVISLEESVKIAEQVCAEEWNSAQ